MLRVWDVAVYLTQQINTATMNIYELITPSDPITFKAENDKIAFACALLLGEGKAGCENKTTGGRVPSLLMFNPDPEKEIADFIGGDFREFMDANTLGISDAFLSFAYGSVSDRVTYDDACSAITDIDKLNEFKAKHEDKNRSSMSQWVKSAWKIGASIKAKSEKTA